MFGYNELIDKEYEKKHEAVLKYTKDDRVEATKILDIDMEYNLTRMYSHWLESDVQDAQNSHDPERVSFFAGLFIEVRGDLDEVEDEHIELRIS